MAKEKKKNENHHYQHKIIDFLKNKKGRSYKRKEISRALDVSQSDYYLFREAMNELSRSGKVMKIKGGRYTSAASLRKIQGAIQVTRKGFAFVADERTEEEIFISSQNLNTALDGDSVEVQLFGVSRGKSKEGRVTQVLSRAKNLFVGTYHKSEYYGFVVPDNRKVYRDFYIPEKKALRAKNGQKVVVELKKWDSSMMNPEAQIVEILGFPDEPGVDVSSVVIGHGLPIKFAGKLEEEAATKELNITPEEIARRLDLRNEVVFTIDPPDAKDFDDAVSLDKLGNGNWKLGVHIADVSYFVNPGTNIDLEALERGTSIYLVDRVIPMLPEHLSNKLCSLQPYEDRMSHSCIMEIDSSSGDVVHYEIKESIINSKRRYTYQEVQDIIDDKNAGDPFANVIKKMHSLSRLLRKKRFQNGSIDFSTPEVKFTLNEKGYPVDIIPLKQMHSNEMIEEFMLMANQTVAKHIKNISEKGKPKPFIYRIHEKPDQEKLTKFRNFMSALGYKIDIKSSVSPKQFQKILKEIEGGKDEIIIKEVALRTMMKAVYSQSNKGHFGLAFKDYTHFTSPIRRYPDLMVHRLLKEYENSVDFKRISEIKRELKKVCKISSERERQALDAERESVRIKQVEWLMQHKDETFEGIISGVMAFGIFVETLPYLIEGLIRIERLEDDYYIYDEKTYTLIGKDTGRTLRLGDAVKVRVANIDRERNEIDFLLAE